MDKAILELFDPAFIIDCSEMKILEINYAFGSISGLSPRRIKRKAPGLEDIFVKTGHEIINILNEAQETSDPALSCELNEMLNDELITFVCKVIPQDNSTALILLNNLTIENILHKKYNILVESAVHIHRKVFDSYYMMSRIPVTVPAALSHPFRDGLNSLKLLKKHIGSDTEALRHFDHVKNSLVRVSGVSLNVQYLLPEVSHKEEALTVGDLFKKYIVPKVSRIKESYLNKIQIEYNLSQKVIDCTYKMDPRKLSDAVVNVIANALESVYEDCMSDELKVRIDSYFIGIGGAELICIDITDNGMHLSGDTAKKMFAPFYSNFDEVSLGLGLTNAKRAIEDHGGDLRFMDDHLDGNKFQIRLTVDEKITLNKVQSRYQTVYMLTEDLDSRLVLNNYLKVSGLDYVCFKSKKDFISAISQFDNKDCLMIDYDPSYEDFLVKLKQKKTNLSIILMLKIQQYSTFLSLNERVRIKDVIIYPPTYDLVVKSLVR